VGQNTPLFSRRIENLHSPHIQRGKSCSETHNCSSLPNACYSSSFGKVLTPTVCLAFFGCYTMKDRKNSPRQKSEATPLFIPNYPAAFQEKNF